MGAFVCFARRQTMYASLALMLTTLCSISFSIPPLWKRIDCSCVSIETRGFASEVRKNKLLTPSFNLSDVRPYINVLWKTLVYYLFLLSMTLSAHFVIGFFLFLSNLISSRFFGLALICWWLTKVPPDRKIILLHQMVTGEWFLMVHMTIPSIVYHTTQMNF